MVIVRAVRLDDLDQLWSLIEQATYGLTTLQISKEQLSERVEHSNFAFTRKTEKAGGEPYVFVMEDKTIGRLVGLSCIFSKTGGYEPFYSYRLVSESNYCELLDQVQEIEMLHLEKVHDGPTEIGSLFLLPDYRGHGRGRLLSLARFTFIAAFPKKFADEVIAEMRGSMTDDGQSPFWDAIGRHFFKMDFPQADSLSTVNKRFIEDWMPHHPIYTKLLPDSARAVMGKVHPNTEPALRMLEAEGFQKIDWIDIFDGGPVVGCRRDAIGAVRRTTSCRVSQVTELVDGSPAILASLEGGFRAVMEPARLTEEGLVVSQLAARLLRIELGARLWMTELYPAKTVISKR